MHHVLTLIEQIHTASGRLLSGSQVGRLADADVSWWTVIRLRLQKCVNSKLTEFRDKVGIIGAEVRCIGSLQTLGTNKIHYQRNAWHKNLPDESV